VYEILCCPAPCSSGKTRALVRRGSRIALANQIALIVQPTTELISKTVSEEIGKLEKKPMYASIHSTSSNSNLSVGHQIADHLRDFSNEGQIIFATHQALEHVPYWSSKKDVHLLIDEEFEAVRCDPHDLPETHHILTDKLVLVPHNTVYSRVAPRDMEVLRRMAKNSQQDEILNALRKIINLLASNHWSTFVNTEQYYRLLARDSEASLTFHSVLEPSFLAGFASVFMASANFQDTAIYRLWSDKGVKFIDDNEFSSELRFTKHENGPSMTIYYVTNKDWSKKYGRETVGGAMVIDRLMTAAKTQFGERPFLWQANKSFKEEPFGTNAHRLPNKPHGLNSYSHISNILFASALNPPPDHCRFLESHGLSRSDVRRMIYFSAAYQAVMRTSARSLGSTEPITVIVPDLGLAEYLADLFPGATVSWLDAGLPKEHVRRTGGRPKKHSSHAERGRTQRREAKQKKLDEYNDLLSRYPQHNREGSCDPDKEDYRVDCTIESITPNCMGVFNGSIFTKKNQKESDGYLKTSCINSFVVTQWGFHQDSCPKSKNLLISPSLYDPSLAQATSRGYENIACCRHIWLDFENGDLRPEAFAALFPSIKMIITNTDGHTNEKPRSRAIILTSTVMTPAVYDTIMGDIRWKLTEAGYSVGKQGKGSNKPKSGLDTSKCTPTSLFALPAQAQLAIESFFTYYEDGREVLDPKTWFMHSIRPAHNDYEDQVVNDGHPRGGVQELVEAAISEWRSTSDGKGNDGFYRLGLKLQKAGLTAL
jgi:hypothetical protein